MIDFFKISTVLGSVFNSFHKVENVKRKESWDTTNSTEKIRVIYTVGFIPWDGITVGKDRIPWEKDRQSVLFYAPAPKTHGILRCF